jgi:potassium-dependent mechanosensitive channel
MLVRLLLFVVMLCAAPLMAQDLGTIPASVAAIDDATAKLHDIDAAFNGRTDAAGRQTLRDQATTISQTAKTQVMQLTPMLAAIDARVAQLGPVTPGVIEAPDIKAQRKQLALERSTVDSAIKRGKLLGTEADQLVAEISESQADAFSEQMSARVASPLTPGFWGPVIHMMPRDLRRTGAFFGIEWSAIRAGTGWPALVGLLVAAAMMFPLRLALKRLGRKIMIERAPGSRLRRSGLAFWLVAFGTLVPGFSAAALTEGFRAGNMLAPAWNTLADTFTRAGFVTGLIVALGGGLLQRRQPSWRLLPISDQGANGLRPWTIALAATVALSVLIGAFSDAVGASGPGSELTDLVIALLHIGVMAGALVAVGRLRAKVVAELEDGDNVPGAAGVAFVSLAAWVAIIVATVALLLGFVSLSLLVSRMLVWIPVVVATLYLLLIACDDICTGAFSATSSVGVAMHRGFGVRPSLIDQFGVALSAVLRLLLIVLAVTLVFTPFGSNIGSLFGEAGKVADGITVGQITISPGAILRAGLVLAIGMFVVRGFHGWLTNRYLPATELDAGARNSISMVARYTGLILATLWALATLGIGIERIALLLSALSVGIGFGLQAITQNFVSGLILLAERPVKIGDWVKIGDQEGDVKRISVRATEIQIADRSTLIVPNSELITKTVLNKTLADPIGRVQLQFSVPIGTDIAQVRQMLTAMFDDTPGVIEDPKPSIFFDSIADGRVNLNCFAYVSSPRAAYGVKSELLFRLLTEMPDAGIELGTTPTQFQFLHAPDGTPPPSPSGSEGPIES